jgi:hypothetical protein
MTLVTTIKSQAGFNDRFVQLKQHTTAYNSIQHSILSATAGPYHNQATRQCDFPTTRTRLGLDDDDDDDGGPYSEEYLSGIV